VIEMSSEADSTLDRALDGGPPAESVAEDLVRARLRDRLFAERGDPVRIGRYTVLHTIGSGGNGVVYAAYDDRLDRKVALKVLSPAGASDPARARKRLVAEAKALAKLAHPNIVTVFEVFVDASRDVVIAMEFVDGETLGAWARRQPRTWREILAVYREAGRGLAAAHAAGMVHRDFKPSNALVGTDGRVRVLDFGLVHVESPTMTVDPEAAGVSLDPDPLGAAESATLPEGGPRDSRTGIVGTPLYMSPEQHARGPVDARSDQFSFCVALWEALMGVPPFDGSSLSELLGQKLRGELVAVEGHGVPPRIRAAIERGLAPIPDHRHPSLDALIAVLREHRQAARRRWLVAAGGLALAGVSATIASLDERPCARAGAAVEGVWNTARAQELRAAFVATGRAHAIPSWQTTHGLVESWAHGWATSTQAACMAHARGEQSAEMLDLRTACLHTRLLDLEALLEVFAHPDDEVVTGSVQAARSLPSIDPCSDVAGLRALSPPPDDPAAREAIDRLLAMLARSRAQMLSGHYADSIAASEAVLGELRAAPWSHPPLRAEALITLAEGLARGGQPRDASQPFREGALLARSLGEEAVFVRGAIGLLWEAGDDRSDFDLAHTWGDLARAALDRIGRDDELAARLHNARGAVLANEQRFDEALAEHRARLAIVGEDDGAAFISLSNIGNIYNHRGEWERAVEHYERAIAVATPEVGSTHPDVLGIQAVMLGVLWRIRPLDDTRQFGDRLVGDLEAQFPATHPHLQTAHANLSNVAAAQGDFDAALHHALEALRQGIAIHGERSHWILSPLLAVSRTLARKGDLSAARSHAQRALEIALETRGPDHLDTAWPLLELGVLELRAADLETALGHFEDARRIAKISEAPDDFIGTVESNVAYALLELGRPDEALDHARAGLEWSERGGSLEVDRLIAHNRWGQALVDLGRLEEAVVALDRTIAGWTKIERPHAQQFFAEFDRMRARVGLGLVKRDPRAARELAARSEDELLHRRVEAWLAAGR
jgi:eukaryotic-like serine/threonine-protein kinase